MENVEKGIKSSSSAPHTLFYLLHAHPTLTCIFAIISNNYLFSNEIYSRAFPWCALAGPCSVFLGLRGPTFTSNPKTDRGIKRMVGERAGKEGRKELVKAWKKLWERELLNSVLLCQRGSKVLLTAGKYTWLCHNYLHLYSVCDLVKSGKPNDLQPSPTWHHQIGCREHQQPV